MMSVRLNRKEILLLLVGAGFGAFFHSYASRSSELGEPSTLALRHAPKVKHSASPNPGFAPVTAQVPQIPAEAASATAPAPPEFNWLKIFNSEPSDMETQMSKWAARDPEQAGTWLNQNRNHAQFADLVRGYAIQVAVINPDAARKWASLIQGKGDVFPGGATLLQHIDAVEGMLRRAETGLTETPPVLPSDHFLPAYQPVLVRQTPGEPPVLEMAPRSPFG